MFPFSSCTPNKQKSHLHTFDYIRIKVSLFIFLSPVLQTLTVKQVTAECIWDRKPSKIKPFKLAVGNSYSEYFLLYPYPQKRFIRRLPVLPGKVQHLDHLCPGTKVFYLFLSHGSICNKCKLQYMHQFMLVFMGKKYRFGKNGTLAYTSHPFIG